MKKYILLIVLIFSVSISFAQKIVVSEIKDATPDGEWTELLVIQDMLDIVGYTIRDNSDAGNWQPAVRFKDHRLWRSLREGTIIVVNHRGGVVDADKADGYIEIGRDASEYFDTYIDGPDPGHDPSLNLNATHDLVQIRDQFGNHVHVLGYMLPTRSGDVFDGLPAPKVGHPNTSARSTRVYPGFNLNDYNGGLSASFALSDFSESKGFPNGNAQGLNTNHLFWRTLREPSWGNLPNLTATLAPDYKSVTLNWNQASTISDPNEGYLIVRYVVNQSQSLNLIDGRIYMPGEAIGTYMIIDTLPDLTKNTYTDVFKYGTFDCGKKYAYRVYIYRYQRSTNPPADVNPENARGRSYNETDYGSTENHIEKTIPPNPIISTLNGELEFCSNENVELQSDIKNTSKYDYQWFNGGTDLGKNDFKIQASLSGTYRLIITDKQSGCSSQSNEITLNFIEASDSYIRNKDNFKNFDRDTIIQICNGETLRLQGFSIPSNAKNNFKWLKDGTVVGTNSDFNITQTGIYKFVVTTNNLCPDTSVVLDVRVFQPNFSLNPVALNFNFDSSPDQDLTITNNSDKDLVIYPSDITISPSGNFSILNPLITSSDPLIVPANGGSKTITIRFQSVDFGEKKATITFRSICNFSKKADLTGIREDTGKTVLLSDPPALNFGKIPSDCEGFSDKKVQIIVSGSKSLITVIQPLTSGAFEVFGTKYTVNPTQTLPKNRIEEIPIRVIATVPGIYYDTLKFAYREIDASKPYDTLRIPLSAELINPTITFVENVLDFSDLPDCITEIDTVITINLTDYFDFYIEKQPNDNNLKIDETLPFVINSPKNYKIKVNIKFTSTDEFTSILKILPCDIDVPVKVIPPNQKLVYNYKDTIDFGKVKNCEHQGDYNLDYNFNVSMNGVYIENVLYENLKFLLGIAKEQKITKGDNILRAIFPLQAIGFEKDSVKFVLGPCMDTITIYFTGERTAPKPASYDKANIDFGSDNLNIVGSEFLTISNENDDEDLIISEIKVPYPFTLVKPLATDLPLIIKKGVPYIAEIRFPRTITGIFSDSVELISTKPCNITQKMEIKGESVDNRLYSLFFDLPEEQTVDLNKEFSVPVNLKFPQAFDINATEIQKIFLFIGYDKAIINLKGVTKVSNSISNSVLTDNGDGNGRIDLDITDYNSFTEGQFITINSQSLLGYDIKTRMRIDSVNYISKLGINTSPDSTLINITGNCNIRNRTVSVGGNVGLALNGSNPANGISEINFSVVSNDITTIKIYNLLGETVSTLVQQSLKPGEYTAFFDTNKISNGQYIILMETGNFKRKLVMSVIN